MRVVNVGIHAIQKTATQAIVISKMYSSMYIIHADNNNMPELTSPFSMCSTGLY